MQFLAAWSCHSRNKLPILIIGGLMLACSTRNVKTKESELKAGSLADELKVFYDVSALPQYFGNVYDAQVSTYDTTWQNNDGFNGTYSFIRRNADSTLVIFDVQGSGVINRIWTPTPTDDTLDFYIDSDRPSFAICYRDLFSGKQFPFVDPLCGNQIGGFYCYMPIPFQMHCKIVSRGKRMQFHQIQYRLYPVGTEVKRFSMNLSDEEKASIKKIQTLWNKHQRSVEDFYPDDILEFNKKAGIKSRETLTVFEINKGGRILGIEMEPASVFEGPDKNIDIRITWDDDKTPAVYCPVADFFGYAFGSSSMQSLLLGTQNNKTYSYFPMPFDRAAKIELVNRANEALGSDILVKIFYTLDARAPEHEGKFYAHWRVGQPEKGKQHTFLDARGKGHYVGTILQSQGLKAGMTIFFEGDDSTSIDGTFRMHGTGSEDYFNGGWYAMLDRWDGKMSLPLHGSLDYSLPFARTGGYRLFLSDKISFQHSFYHGIEHGPVGNAFPVDYTSLGLYYANTPPPVATAPTTDITNVFSPDTLIIYPQLMDYNIFGNIGVKTTWQYGTGGESYFFTPENETWLRISLKEIPHGSYKMFFDLQRKPDGCTFSLWQRQSLQSPWISTYSASEERVRDLSVGDFDIQEFKDTMTIRFKTDAQKNTFLLHRIILVRN